MDLSPIILFVYNRPWHTKKTLEALSENVLADECKLFIFADGPKAGANEENLGKIQEVRKIIREKNWCKEVVIKEHDINKGLANSIIEGVTNVLDQYGKAIVLEDDLITSRFFLKFMNDGLSICERVENIYGVSGYCYVEDEAIRTPYLLPIGSSWGWATWKNKWSCFEKNASLLIEEVNKQGLKKKFDFGGYPYYSMLYDNYLEKNDSWGIRFYASFFLKSGLFLFPNKTLVTNIGFDNSGVHSGDKSYFDPLIFNGAIDISHITPSLNLAALKRIQTHFETRFARKKKKHLASRIIARMKKLISTPARMLAVINGK